MSEVDQSEPATSGQAPPGVTVTKTLKDGIEWISYRPAEKRHETPILFQHGMWHAAWCWQGWQEALAQAER